jgi:polygalacturonase
VNDAPASVGWEAVAQIEARVEAPTFPDRDFSIRDYGARDYGARGDGARDDGVTDCKSAFAQAIAACHEAGGGRVVVPAGNWLTNGPIHLLSNVNLHIDSKATIRFSTEPDDYLPNVFTRFEGTEVMNYSPLIYAFEQENIAITGGGTVDGQASGENWWRWKGRWGGDIEHGWQQGDPDQAAAIAKLIAMADQGVPTIEREFGPGSLLRSSFVQPYRCKNVLIEGITVKNSPMWCVHPVLCENVTVRGITVDSHGPNNDGCNPESCRYVIIEECLFNTGDDCIAIKSGRNTDGRRLAAPSEYYLIRNCQMKDGHGGVVLGSEMSGGVRNIFVENCRMDSPHLERAIRLKSNSLRGGYLENLFVRNIEVGEVSDAVIRINLLYDRDRGEHYPAVRNIHISNVTAKKSNYPLYLMGIPERPIENVVLENCTFAGAKRPSIIENVAELTMRNVTQPAN